MEAVVRIGNTDWNPQTLLENLKSEKKITEKEWVDLIVAYPIGFVNWVDSTFNRDRYGMTDGWNSKDVDVWVKNNKADIKTVLTLVKIGWENKWKMPENKKSGIFSTYQLFAKKLGDDKGAAKKKLDAFLKKSVETDVGETDATISLRTESVAGSSVAGSSSKIAASIDSKKKKIAATTLAKNLKKTGEKIEKKTGSDFEKMVKEHMDKTAWVSKSVLAEDTTTVLNKKREKDKDEGSSRRKFIEKTTKMYKDQRKEIKSMITDFSRTPKDTLQNAYGFGSNTLAYIDELKTIKESELSEQTKIKLSEMMAAYGTGSTLKDMKKYFTPFSGMAKPKLTWLKDTTKFRSIIRNSPLTRKNFSTDRLFCHMWLLHGLFEMGGATSKGWVSGDDHNSMKFDPAGDKSLSIFYWDNVIDVTDVIHITKVHAWTNEVYSSDKYESKVVVHQHVWATGINIATNVIECGLIFRIWYEGWYWFFCWKGTNKGWYCIRSDQIKNMKKKDKVWTVTTFEKIEIVEPTREDTKNRQQWHWNIDSELHWDERKTDGGFLSMTFKPTSYKNETIELGIPVDAAFEYEINNTDLYESIFTRKMRSYPADISRNLFDIDTFNNLKFVANAYKDKVPDFDNFIKNETLWWCENELSINFGVIRIVRKLVRKLVRFPSRLTLTSSMYLDILKIASQLYAMLGGWGTVVYDIDALDANLYKILSTYGMYLYIQLKWVNKINVCFLIEALVTIFKSWYGQGKAVFLERAWKYVIQLSQWLFPWEMTHLRYQIQEADLVKMLKYNATVYGAESYDIRDLPAAFLEAHAHLRDLKEKYGEFINEKRKNVSDAKMLLTNLPSSATIDEKKAATDRLNAVETELKIWADKMLWEIFSDYVTGLGALGLTNGIKGFDQLSDLCQALEKVDKDWVESVTKHKYKLIPVISELTKATAMYMDYSKLFSTVARYVKKYKGTGINSAVQAFFDHPSNPYTFLSETESDHVKYLRDASAGQLLTPDNWFGKNTPRDIAVTLLGHERSWISNYFSPLETWLTTRTSSRDLWQEVKYKDFKPHMMVKWDSKAISGLEDWHDHVEPDFSGYMGASSSGSVPISSVGAAGGSGGSSGVARDVGSYDVEMKVANDEINDKEEKSKVADPATLLTQLQKQTNATKKIADQINLLRVISRTWDPEMMFGELSANDIYKLYIGKLPESYDTFYSTDIENHLNDMKDNDTEVPYDEEDLIKDVSTTDFWAQNIETVWLMLTWKKLVEFIRVVNSMLGTVLTPAQMRSISGIDKFGVIFDDRVKFTDLDIIYDNEKHLFLFEQVDANNTYWNLWVYKPHMKALKNNTRWAGLVFGSAINHSKKLIWEGCKSWLLGIWNSKKKETQWIKNLFFNNKLGSIGEFNDKNEFNSFQSNPSYSFTSYPHVSNNLASRQFGWGFTPDPWASQPINYPHRFVGFERNRLLPSPITTIPSKYLVKNLIEDAEEEWNIEQQFEFSKNTF
jgi:hypothetical protein